MSLGISTDGSDQFLVKPLLFGILLFPASFVVSIFLNEPLEAPVILLTYMYILTEVVGFVLISRRLYVVGKRRMAFSFAAGLVIAGLLVPSLSRLNEPVVWAGQCIGQVLKARDCSSQLP
ncbi:hypothetical protein GCM10010994_05410 [Chelatococcus reniformis]|uniref:Uncharacterized protein n=1 Tax=Chelatococcus reniformis TaxID=1494448 RepID=A0A916X6Z8_9HYPH|nr:hypothetical protein GCM10010994_05410 [Chelatococcus reniformis]